MSLGRRIDRQDFPKGERGATGRGRSPSLARSLFTFRVGGTRGRRVCTEDGGGFGSRSGEWVSCWEGFRGTGPCEGSCVTPVNG